MNSTLLYGLFSKQSTNDITDYSSGGTQAQQVILATPTPRRWSSPDWAGLRVAARLTMVVRFRVVVMGFRVMVMGFRVVVMGFRVMVRFRMVVRAFSACCGKPVDLKIWK